MLVWICISGCKYNFFQNLGVFYEILKTRSVLPQKKNKKFPWFPRVHISGQKSNQADVDSLWGEHNFFSKYIYIISKTTE